MDLKSNSFQDLYLSYCQDMTDAPTRYHEAISYLILSSIVNKNVYMPFGHKKLYTNLYMLIIGPSTLNRKSWSVDIGMNLVKQAYGYEYELPETSSRESLISELSRKDRMPFGCGAIVIDELKSFIDRIKRGNYHLGLFQDLSMIYDSRTIYRRKGVSEEEKEVFFVEDPFVSFVGCCSFDWLTDSIESSDFLGGFFSRFLWIVHNEKMVDPMVEPKEFDPLKRNELIYRIENIKNIIGTCVWDEDSYKTYSVWYKTFREATQGLLWDANYERLTIIVKKIAMLIAVSRLEKEGNLSPGVITIINEDVKTAIKFVVKTTSAFKDVIIAENKDDLLLRKVCRKIFKENKITRSDLLVGVRGLNSQLLSKIIQTLKEAEVIDIILSKEKDSTGRTFEVVSYFANGNMPKFLRS